MSDGGKKSKHKLLTPIEPRKEPSKLWPITLGCFVFAVIGVLFHRWIGGEILTSVGLFIALIGAIIFIALITKFLIHFGGGGNASDMKKTGTNHRSDLNDWYWHDVD